MTTATYTQSVAAEIRAEMGRQRLSQRDLGIKTGMSRGYLNRRMTGAVAWSTDDIERIAAALGVPIHELASPRQVAS